MVAGLGAYRQIWPTPRPGPSAPAGLVARLPLSMTGLGIVLLISLTSGSFGRAGLIAAVGTLTAAVVAPMWGQAIDRLGQARVLVVAADDQQRQPGAAGHQCAARLAIRGDPGRRVRRGDRVLLGGLGGPGALEPCG